MQEVSEVTVSILDKVTGGHDNKETKEISSWDMALYSQITLSVPLFSPKNRNSACAVMSPRQRCYQLNPALQTQTLPFT